MKEKFKNFLLKIKKYFTEKFVCNRIKLIAFAFIVIFVTCLCNIVTFTFDDQCFNETHTSQIVVSPQAEELRIDRDIKGANPTQNDYVNPSTNYDSIYFAQLNDYTSSTILDIRNLIRSNGIDLSPLGENAYLYPFYCYDNGQSYVLGAYMLYGGTTNEVFLGNIFVIPYDGLSYTNVGYLFDYTFNKTSGEIYRNDYFQQQWFFENLGVAQDNIDFFGQNIPIGYLNTLLFNVLSSIPFEIDGGYQEGYDAGYASGYTDGNVNGFFEGEEYGYNNGYTNGLNDGFENGFLEGEEYGYNNGYGVGYIDGKNAGVSITNPLNPIMDFIADGASVISNVFSFEILPNLSLGTMLLFPLAIALIWFVVKLFMGG